MIIYILPLRTKNVGNKLGEYFFNAVSIKKINKIQSLPPNNFHLVNKQVFKDFQSTAGILSSDHHSIPGAATGKSVLFV